MTARQVFDSFKTPITLLVLLGILLFGGWWGWKHLMMPLPADMPTACETRSVGKELKAPDVTVNVLNGGMSRGLATSVSKTLVTKGFQVNDVGNTDERIGDTIVRGATTDAPEVKLVAGYFRNAKVEADNRIDHSVDVLVGNNWIPAGNPNASFIDDAPASVAVPGGTACLPPSQTPTATPSS